MTPIFFFAGSLPFPILSITLKIQKNLCTWEVLIISHNTIHIGSKWYMDNGVRDLEVAFLRLILSNLMTYVAKIYQISLYMLC